MSYAIQSKSGQEQNKLYSDDTEIHDWYRFVLSYPPHLVRYYIEKFELNPTHTILDPFSGAGTTLVESKKHGIPSIGVEANPVVQMAAKTKVDWDIDCAALLKQVGSISKEAEERLIKYGDNLKSLDKDREALIIKHSISPIPLHKSLVLLDVISETTDKCFHNIARTALAKQLIFSYSNLHFGPEVGISRKKKKDVDVVKLWQEQVHKIARDLKKYSCKKDIFSDVYLGDSRSIGNLLMKQSIDAVITSPPYPNKKDYTRTTRLESVLLGFMNIKSDLRERKESLLRSNTRNIYKGDDDEKWISNYQFVLDLAKSIEDKRIRLGKMSGFERMYHKVVKNYFGGMARHLESLKTSLRPGAQLAYVVGDQASYFQTQIKTGAILSEIAVDIGYELVGTDIFRTRLSTVTKKRLNEEVVLLRWKG